MGNPPKIPCKNAILLRREQQQECRKIERDHIQEFVTAAYLAIEQRDEAWKKIERLRARVVELNTLIEDKADQIMELHPRIEEMERDRDFWAKAAKEYKDDYNRRIRTGKCADGHHITDDQIDAAIKRIGTYGYKSSDWWSAWDALNELNIFWCEACEGEGSCPNCDGNGYYIQGGVTFRR